MKLYPKVIPFYFLICLRVVLQWYKPVLDAEQSPVPQPSGSVPASWLYPKRHQVFQPTQPEPRPSLLPPELMGTWRHFQALPPALGFPMRDPVQPHRARATRGGCPRSVPTAPRLHGEGAEAASSAAAWWKHQARHSLLTCEIHTRDCKRQTAGSWMLPSVSKLLLKGLHTSKVGFRTCYVPYTGK